MNFPPFTLERAASVLMARFDRVVAETLELSPGEWRVLLHLRGSDGDMTVSGLANACLVQQPTMTKLLDRMVQSGLVARHPQPSDRRVVLMRMTERGAQIASELGAKADDFAGRDIQPEVLSACDGIIATWARKREVPMQRAGV